MVSVILLIEKQFASLIVLLTMPVKALPGPISIKSLTPALDILIILSLQLTVEYICSINNFLILSEFVSGVAVTLFTILNNGSLKSVFCIFYSMIFAAGFISEQ